MNTFLKTLIALTTTLTLEPMALAQSAGEPKVITFYQDVRYGDLEALQLKVNELQLEVGDDLLIKLYSRGGLTAEALNIRDFLRWLSEKGVRIITEVEEQSLCASACIILYSAGDVRRAYENSIFFFHGPRIGFGTPEEAEGLRLKAITAFIESLRMADSDFADFIDREEIAAEGFRDLTGAEIESIAPGYLDIISSEQ